MPILAALLAFATCLGLLFLLVRRFAHFVLDRPNERSLHERPIPRTGGLAALAGIATCALFGLAGLWLPLLLAALLAALSFFDDLYRIRSSWRLTGHLAAAALFVWYVLSPMHPVEMVVLVLALAWLTNLYNFMDGADGLAGGMSVIGFTAYALAAWLAGEGAISLVGAAVAGASAGFLIYNFHPARIFLGDVGAIALGFLAGALGLLGWRNDAWPLWFPLLVFGPFIGDATLTLVRRAVRGKPVWRAHREHYYQRMIRMGLGHRTTAWIAYAAMALCACAALFARDQSPVVQFAAFFGASVALGIAAGWVDLRWARFAREAGVST